MAVNLLRQTATQELVAVTADHAETPQASPREVLRNRNFRLLWLGEGISLLGDQFYMIALPWLVLQLTGNALAMSTVLAMSAIPRALFMLVGGAVTDRFSPRLVMLVSNVVRGILVALLTVLILTNAIQLWMLYLLALAFGLADAFFFPASSSIVPQIVSKENLQTGNAVIQGTGQLSLFLGPVLAGLMIALLGGSTQAADGTDVPGMTGIALAFAFDSLTFLVSIVCLTLMNVSSGHEANEEESMWTAIKSGLTAVWNDGVLRSYFFLVAAANFLIVGPLIIGIPVIADTRLPEGAAAFGIIMSGFGLGTLIGTILAGVLPKVQPQRLGTLLLIIWSVMGLGIIGLGLTDSTPVAAIASALMGLANGYVVILFITWLQGRTPEAMLGRMMSVLMFASIGVEPISTVITGALIEVNTTGLFVVAGAAMTLITLASLILNPAIRHMD